MAEKFLDAAEASMGAEATALNGPAPDYHHPEVVDMSREAIIGRRHHREHARTLRHWVSWSQTSHGMTNFRSGTF